MSQVSTPPPTDVADRPATQRVTEDKRGARVASWIAMPVGIVALLVAGSLVSNRFLTVQNLTNVLISMSIVGIIVVGMTFVFITRGMADLSVPGTLAIGSIAVLSLQGQVGVLPAAAAGVLAAALAGAVNGLLIGYARVNPVIATLAVGTVVLGLAQAFVGGVIVYGDDPGSQAFINSRVLGVPVLVMVFAAVAVLGHVLLSRTTLGRWTYAVGSNLRATEASAVPVRPVRAWAFVLTAALSGFSGVLLGVSLQTARPLIGQGYEFDAITAVVVGGVSLLGGFGSIPRAVAGLVFVQLLTNIMVLQGVPSPAQGLVKGALIAVAVSVDVYFRRRGGRA